MASRSAAKIEIGPWMDFTATWYSPLGGVGNGLTTKSGLTVNEHMIATDPDLIPLGSIVEIQYADGTTETKLAADTGGRIHGHIIDVFNWSEAECNRLGRQHIKLRVVGHTELRRK